jgi:hypothetical protein
MDPENVKVVVRIPGANEPVSVGAGSTESAT